MKKLLLSCAALASFAAAALPASAQPYSPYTPMYGSIDAREAAAARRIGWCQRSGSISGAEAWRLRAELRRIERLEDEMREDGLQRQEYWILQRLLMRLEAQISASCRPLPIRPDRLEPRFERPVERFGEFDRRFERD